MAMGKERELWCDGDKAVAIKHRYESLLMSFVKHHDFKDCDGRKGDTYACNLDGGGCSLAVEADVVSEG